jgi:hypothetical protein
VERWRHLSSDHIGHTGYLGSIQVVRLELEQSFPRLKLASKPVQVYLLNMSFMLGSTRQYNFARITRNGRHYIANMSSGIAPEGHKIPLWINGKDVVTPKTFDVQHPSSGRTVSSVCSASEDDV